MIIKFRMMIPSNAYIQEQYAKERVLEEAAETLKNEILKRLDPCVNTSLDAGFNVFEVEFDTHSLDEVSE